MERTQATLQRIQLLHNITRYVTKMCLHSYCMYDVTMITGQDYIIEWAHQ